MARTEKSTAELLLQDTYTPKELSALADLPLDAINMACYSGELKANIVDHDIISIKREDALEWLEKF